VADGASRPRGFDDAFDEDYLAIADHGMAFLLEEMWDENGGFVWEVERDGTTSKPNRHLYGQSFGLYAPLRVRSCCRDRGCR